MSLQLFILNNGREVIGKLKQSSIVGMSHENVTLANGLRIESPRILHFTPTQDGESYGIELFPYSMTNPDGVHVFDKSAIASISETIPDDVEKGYVQQTTGISIVSSLRL
jgi:hypothetical protein